ncbi:MAG: 2-oxo-4-hydroxy-4-carboxy-5-ureidoimidazoline decarboxylase [Verrucomicrobiota bacterium]
MSQLTITALNQLEPQAFTETLSGIYESSPWVPQKTFSKAPFEDLSKLAQALQDTVMQASRQNKLELIQAHPDLGGKLGRKTELTPESQREQSRLALDALNDSEFEEFHHLNQTYREKFGFPFIICVGLVSDRQEILTAFRRRIALTPDEEFNEALTQIHHIALLRLKALIEA